MKTTPEKIRPETPLSNLSIEHWELVLCELYALMPRTHRGPHDRPFPISVRDLALELNWPTSNLIKSLEAAKHIASHLNVSQKGIQRKRDALCVLDLDLGPPAALTLWPVDRATVKAPGKQRYICLGRDFSASLSAALYLRQHGWLRAQAFDGLSADLQRLLSCH